MCRYTHTAEGLLEQLPWEHSAAQSAPWRCFSVRDPCWLGWGWSLLVPCREMLGCYQTIEDSDPPLWIYIHSFMNKLFPGATQSSSVVLWGQQPCPTDGMCFLVSFPPSFSKRLVGFGCCHALQVPSRSLYPPLNLGVRAQMFSSLEPDNRETTCSCSSSCFPGLTLRADSIICEPG